MTASDSLVVPEPNESSLDLHLAAQIEITSVSSNGSQLPWNRSGEVLRIGPLPSVGKLLTLKIDYRGRFTDPVSAAPLNNEDPTYGVAAAITPRGVFLAAGSGWCPELPGAKAYYRVTAIAPTGWWTVMAGRLLDHQNSTVGATTVWESETPLEGLTLAAGPWQMRQERVGALPVYTFFAADHADLAATYLDAARKDLALYQDLFGPYPFAKFAIVENFFPTGYGFPSWTLLGSSILPLPFIVTTSLAHEIAHSWWGNGVRVDYRHGNWCEGLATYVADYLTKERRAPAEATEYRRNILRDYSTLVTPANDYPLADFVRRRTKVDQAIGYGKSAMVFHMARQWVGDEAFWRGLRQLAKEKMFQEASWSDFARAFDPTDKVGMKAFMYQWVERAGAPQLELDQVRAVREEREIVVSGRIRQESPGYRLRLPMIVKTAESESRTEVDLEGGTADFRQRTEHPPRILQVDPDAEVFRRLAPEEIPATVNSLRRQRPLLAVVANGASPALQRAAHDLLTGLSRSATWVAEDVVKATDAASSDLLLVGWPGRRDLQPPLPADLTLAAGHLFLAGKTFDQSGAVLFAALRGAGAPQQRVGLFWSRGDAGAEIAARKIPHYGKYSYLVFVDGSNHLKGVWPVTSSPLQHCWSPAQELPSRGESSCTE